VNDELRQGGVEHVIAERQFLRRGVLDVDAGMPLSSCRDEGLGRIHGRDRIPSQPPDQLGGERAGAAAHVEHPLTGVHRREIGEPGRAPSTGP
jgi:hypothetical protein